MLPHQDEVISGTLELHSSLASRRSPKTRGEQAPEARHTELQLTHGPRG
jgi:hypothetical protein